MTDQTPIAAADAGPRLHGVIDVLRPDRMAGWVIDRSDPAAHATVEIRRDGQVVGRVTADRPRKDLESRGVGTGRYGFSMSFDPPLERGLEFTVTASAISHDGVEQPLQATARTAAASAEQKAMARLLAELAEVRTELAALRGEASAREEEARRMAERMETVQLRIEAALARTEEPPPPSTRWLWAVALGAGAIGFGSLGLGLLSLWTG